MDMTRAIDPAVIKRKSMSGGVLSSGRAVKRRASKACQCCRSRKVRCDVVESGIPCTNCRLDEVDCCVTEGKRRRKSIIDEEFRLSPTASSCEDRDDVQQFPMLDEFDQMQTWTNRGADSVNNNAGQQKMLHKPHMLYEAHKSKITPEEQIRRLSILSARGISVQNPAALTSPYFPALQLQREVVLPAFLSPLPDRISTEDVEYLQKKGVLLIPEAGLRNELLRNYVQWVHPYLPLLDLDELLTTIHRDDGSTKISLLLFQAVMFAATAYIDMRFLTAQGYSSRKAARKAFFQRVKLLYDFDYETDRVTVVQSILLMTYWYESPDDPKDVWHWLGVAISLARTIGLNCDTSASPLPLQKQRLWKRIWWCCYTRDRLVSVGMRRPIRLQENEFDTPMLEIADFENDPLSVELTRMLGGCSVIKDSEKRLLLAHMFIAVVSLCQLLTNVLAVQYSITGHRLGATQETTMRLVPRQTAADSEDVTKCDQSLQNWYDKLPIEVRYYSKSPPKERNIRNDGEVLNMHRALLSGLYFTASSALHRPQMMPATPNLKVAEEMKVLSKSRVREASSAITDIFRDLHAHDLIRYLPNTGVTVLLPAIIVHLLDIKSPDPETRNLSTRRFQFCMQALQKLQDIYASAEFAFSFLDAAIKKADLPVNEKLPRPRHHANSSPSGYFATARPMDATPPPELLQQNTILSSQLSSNQTMSAVEALPSQFKARHLSSGQITPPCSDRSGTSVRSHHRFECARTDSRALPNMTLDPADHNDCIHISYGTNDQVAYSEEEEDYSIIDEEAIRDDFDQLINLEGEAVNEPFVVERSPEQLALDGMDWDAIYENVKGLVHVKKEPLPPFGVGNAHIDILA